MLVSPLGLSSPSLLLIATELPDLHLREIWPDVLLLEAGIP